jgi:type IV pilus assembly protein PilQ
MNRVLRAFLALILFLSQGNGTILWAAGRTRKKTPETSAASISTLPIVELRDLSVEDNQVRISLNQLPPYKISLLENPSSLVVELTGVVNKTAVDKTIKGNLFDHVRVEQSGAGETLVSRVVLDLLQPVNYETHTAGSDILLTLHPNPAADAQKRNIDLLGNLPQEKVDLDFEGEDIGSALRLMAEMSKINITYGLDVVGNITLHLKSVPFDQAFRTVLSMNNLVARQLGDNILWIMTPASLTQNRNNASIANRTIILNYAKAAEIKANLDMIRSAGGRKGATLVNQRTNSITIMDTEEGLDEAQRLIALIDKKPMQVLIEARLVEVDLDNSLDLGIQWGAAGGFSNAGTNYGIGTSQVTGSPTNAFSGTANGILNGTPAAAGSPNYVSPTSPASQTSPATGVNVPAATTAGAITFGFINNTASLLATINAMASKNKSRVLSAPKIMTLSSEEAKIEADEQIPYPITSVTGTGVSQQSFQFVSAGIILTVTPTVNSDGQVMMKINPVSSFPAPTALTSVGPTIETRSAETTVLVKDGQTIVIGGLINETDTDTVEKVPLLGDIPILGAFFRRQLKSKNRNELLVFVTPHVIKN